MKNQDNLVPQLISSAGRHHDRIRCHAIIWGQSHNYHVYSEPLGYGTYKPDLVFRQRKRHNSKAPIVFIEIQKDGGDKAWVKKTIKKYHGKQLMIIDPERYPRTDPGEIIYKNLSKQLDLETDMMRLGDHPKPRETKPCRYCEKKHSIYQIYIHEKKCPLNPTNKEDSDES